MLGRTIAHYRITEKIGAGGMGEVWRATDTKLHRDVALKVLPEAFARDAERMGRFEREAHILASLNHPNIASIYGLEEAGGVRCLVLELVEGESLLTKINSGALPLDEALGIARQIAEALEAAHEKGIIHRDLKPANVKLTPEGKVKVLDFGLARALEGDSRSAPSDASLSPTLTMAATQAGTILGTAAYMSPEQARGRTADRRADIWAFGVLLLEMLTGRQTFAGETVSDVLAAVLKTDPDWDSVPAETPVAIRRLLRRCLEKDPRRRLRDIGEASISIEDALRGAEETSVGNSSAAVVASAPQRGRQAILLLGALAFGALVAGIAVWRLKSAPEPPLRKLDLAVADLALPNLARLSHAISPDDRRVAYVSSGRLWIRDLDRREPRAVSSSGEILFVFWSQDGGWLGYASGSKLWKVPAGGGESTAITDLTENPVGGAGGSWGADDNIVYSLGIRGLLTVPGQGGDPKPFLEIDPATEGDLHQPYVLPGGKGVVFVVHRKNRSPDTLALQAGARRKILLQLEGQSLWLPTWSPTGHILYVRWPGNPGVWALPFSLASLEATGEPFLVAPDAGQLSVSRNGTLAIVRGLFSGMLQLEWINRNGKTEETIGQPAEYNPWPNLSPDASRAAVSIREGENADIWIVDLLRGTRTRLTFSPEPDIFAAWSPLGDRIAFMSNDRSSGLATWLIPADGSREPERVVSGGGATFSPDGKLLVYSAPDQAGRADLWTVPLDGESKPVPFLKSTADETAPVLSPDGHWIAYFSNESGRDEVYLKRFPGGEGKWQVSTDEGELPQWSRDGRRIFYAQGDDIMEVEVSTSPTLALGVPKRLFTRTLGGRRFGPGYVAGFAVSSDGQRFLTFSRSQQLDAPTGLNIVENWFAEFRDRK